MQNQPLSGFILERNMLRKVNLATNAKRRKVFLNSPLQYSINWYRPVDIVTIGYYLSSWEQVSQLS